MLSFSTTRRHQLRAKLSPKELEAHLSRIPNSYQRGWQREVIEHGVAAPIVTDAVRLYDTLLTDMEASLEHTTYLAGDKFSLADAAVVPYITRLQWLAMHELWHDRPNVARWLANVQARDSYRKAVTDVVSSDAVEVLREYGGREWPGLRAKLLA